MAHIPSVVNTKDSQRRSDRLVARITPEDKSLLLRAVALEGSTLASFVVTHVRDAAEEVVRKHERITLNEAESKRFVEALLSPPPKPTPRFLKALAGYRENVTER